MNRMIFTLLLLLLLSACATVASEHRHVGVYLPERNCLQIPEDLRGMIYFRYEVIGDDNHQYVRVLSDMSGSYLDECVAFEGKNATRENYRLPNGNYTLIIRTVEAITRVEFSVSH